MSSNAATDDSDRVLTRTSTLDDDYGLWLLEVDIPFNTDLDEKMFREDNLRRLQDIREQYRIRHPEIIWSNMDQWLQDAVTYDAKNILQYLLNEIRLDCTEGVGRMDNPWLSSLTSLDRLGNMIETLITLSIQNNSIRVFSLLLSLENTFPYYLGFALESLYPLRAAIEHGRMNMLPELLQRQHDVNTVRDYTLRLSPEITSILSSLPPCSAEHRRTGVRLFRMFLRHGLDLKRAPEKHLAIVWACAAGHRKSVEELLDSDPTIIDNHDRFHVQPLMVAASNGNVELVAILLRRGSDCSLRDSNGSTALHHAAVKDGNLSIRMLLGAGADPTIQNWIGRTPLHVAAVHGAVRNMELLLQEEKWGQSAKDAQGNNALMLAVERGHLDCARLSGLHADGLLRSDFAGEGAGKSMARYMDLSGSFHSEEVDTVLRSYFWSSFRHGELRWLCLPWNHLGWADIISQQYLSHAKTGNPKVFTAFQNTLTNGQSLVDSYRAYPSFMRPCCEIRGLQARDSSNGDADTGPTTISQPYMIHLVLPYLNLEGEKDNRQKRLREAFKGSLPGAVVYPRSFLSTENILFKSNASHALNELHVGRTLGQYHSANDDFQGYGTDTCIRYQRQHSKSTHQKEAVIMVDQLWLWVLEGQLVLTACPGHLMSSRKNTRMAEVKLASSASIHDLTAAIIAPFAASLTVPLAHYDPDDHEEQIDLRDDVEGLPARRDDVGGLFALQKIFEWGIAEAVNLEAYLFRDFNLAARSASASLQPQLSGLLRGRDPYKDHVFSVVNKLLDISQETELLIETKDMRDQIEMLQKVFDDQRYVFKELATALRQLGAVGAVNTIEGWIRQNELDVQEFNRMRRETDRICSSVTDLLDLKQKHGNLLEARFARAQAESTAQQGQVLLAFTIVTIVFLPMSFMASFLAIPFAQFPRNDTGVALPMASYMPYVLVLGPVIAIILIVSAVGFNGFLHICHQAMDMVLRRQHDVRVLPSGNETRRESYSTSKARDESPDGLAKRHTSGEDGQRASTTAVSLPSTVSNGASSNGAGVVAVENLHEKTGMWRQRFKRWREGKKNEIDIELNRM